MSNLGDVVGTALVAGLLLGVTKKMLDQPMPTRRRTKGRKTSYRKPANLGFGRFDNIWL